MKFAGVIKSNEEFDMAQIEAGGKLNSSAGTERKASQPSAATCEYVRGNVVRILKRHIGTHGRRKDQRGGRHHRMPADGDKLASGGNGHPVAISSRFETTSQYRTDKVRDFTERQQRGNIARSGRCNMRDSASSQAVCQRVSERAHHDATAEGRPSPAPAAYEGGAMSTEYGTQQQFVVDEIRPSPNRIDNGKLSSQGVQCGAETRQRVRHR